MKRGVFADYSGSFFALRSKLRDGVDFRRARGREVLSPAPENPGFTEGVRGSGASLVGKFANSGEDRQLSELPFLSLTVSLVWEHRGPTIAIRNLGHHWKS